MASQEPTPIGPLRKKCIFCKIADGNDPKTELLYQDNELVVFRDIHPATEHHFLIVTKEHLSNPKSLDPSNLPLVEQMVRVGSEMLVQRGADLSDSRFGFHWPPFNSVGHLHLHAMAPVSRLGFLGRIIFRPNTIWFVTAAYVIERLAKQNSE